MQIMFCLPQCVRKYFFCLAQKFWTSPKHFGTCKRTGISTLLQDLTHRDSITLLVAKMRVCCFGSPTFVLFAHILWKCLIWGLGSDGQFLVKYFYYCIDPRKRQIWWLGWTILGKTALIYSVVTIFHGRRSRPRTIYPISGSSTVKLRGSLSCQSFRWQI
jgi:hypothetical protein